MLVRCLNTFNTVAFNMFLRRKMLFQDITFSTGKCSCAFIENYRQNYFPGKGVEGTNIAIS